MIGWWPGAVIGGPNDDPLLESFSHGPVDTGDNADLVSFFTGWAYEDPTDNRIAATVPITYREADLEITNLQVPPGVSSGQTVPVTYTVTNIGARDTRANIWTDGIFLSRDVSLDADDTRLLVQTHTGILKAGDSYTVTANVKIPDDISGDFHLLLYTDTAAFTDPAGHPSNIGFNLYGLAFQLASPVGPWDLVSTATRDLARGSVAEYQGEGNNITAVDLPIALTPPPDLKVSSLTAPLHAYAGGQIDVQWTVTNAGGDTVTGQQEWKDLVYLSRDDNLDIKADTYLGFVRHIGFLGAGQSYAIDDLLTLPSGILGPYYVFVIADTPLTGPRGLVFESNERNNDTHSNVPMVIDYPPPSDLQVTSITTPVTATVGEPISLTWTVTNNGTNPASGMWSDALYLSPTTSWSLTNPFIGTLEFQGTLLPGQSYTQTLLANVPSLTPAHITSSSGPISSTRSTRPPANRTTRPHRPLSSKCPPSRWCSACPSRPL